MKKSFTLGLLLAIAGAWVAQAAPVGPDRAKQIALNFTQGLNGAQSNMTAKSIEKLNSGLYLVNLSPRGFVLVASDDCAVPVLGYSLDSNLDATRMPEQMQYVLGETSDLIKQVATKGTVNNDWNRIEKGTYFNISRASSNDVEPLILVHWNQSPPYNKYCPGTGSNKAIVGCVAVAMSQAMSVQKYPSKFQGTAKYVAPGYGQLSVNGDAESPYDWDAIMSGANQYDEAARLMYHAGVSVSMGYGSDGSGIPSNEVYRISNALKNNFGYGDDVEYHWRDSYHGDWEQLILNELNAGRAVIYNGIDKKGGYGHSFNIDGYQARTGFYHLNWGWGGYGDAYFSIDNLGDSRMGMKYDSNNVVVTGVGSPNTLLRSIQLTDLTISAGIPEGSTVSAVLVNGELPTSDMTVTVLGEYDNATKKNKDLPIKYQSDGTLVTTKAITANDQPFYVMVTVTSSKESNARLTLGFTINVESPKTIAQKTALSYNRNEQVFTVQTRYNSTYKVVNSQGALVTEGRITTLPKFEFNRSALTPGDNVVTITSTLTGDSHSFKIKL